MRALKLSIVCVAASAAIAACGGAATNNSPANNGNKAAANGNSAPASSATPAVAQIDGKQLYADNCMICHKDKGTGGPVTVQGKKLKPIDLTSERRKKQSDDDMLKDIAEGVPDEGMPAFKDKLKPVELKQIVTYIRTLQN